MKRFKQLESVQDKLEAMDDSMQNNIDYIMVHIHSSSVL